MQNHWFPEYPAASGFAIWRNWGNTEDEIYKMFAFIWLTFPNERL